MNASALAARKDDLSRSLLGLIFVFSLFLFIGVFAWLASGQTLIPLQLPLLLLSVLAVAASGFLYFLNPSQWLPFFLIGLVYFSFEFTVRGGAGGGGGDAQSLMKGALTLAMAVLAAFTSFKAVFRTPLLCIFFGYSVFALFSAVYSPLLIIGVAAGVALMGISLMAAKLAIGTMADIEGFWKAIYWASVLTCLLSWLLLAVSPTQARDVLDPSRYRLRGVTGAANSLGPIMGIGCIVAVFMARNASSVLARRMHWGMLLPLGAALVLTDSRSSMLGLVAGGLGGAVIAGGMGPLGLLFMLTLFVMALVVVLYPGLQEMLLSMLAAMFSRSGQVSELTTFTGRQQIWEASWKLIDDKPWFGYGMSSVKAVLPRAFSDEWGNTVGTAHNSLLESLISVGWIGTLPLLTALVICLWRLSSFIVSTSRQARPPTDKRLRDMAVCALSCLLMMLVQGFSEKAFAGHPGSPMLALGAVVATAAFISLQVPVRRRL